MANLNAALQHIKRTRNRQGPVRSDRFDEYRHEYEGILRATEMLGGDPAVDELIGWMIDETEANRRLPRPAGVRERARRICRDRGASIPRDSPLRT
ncbi:MAG: hypothetical protein R3324_01115 [Halobacteriales archaeon]|nr:hypothetical protein [Halobacteriales archaeon]